MKPLAMLKALSFFHQRKDHFSAVWETAEPILLDDLRAQLATLVSQQLPEKRQVVKSELDAMTIEQLWRVFESLDDIDDCKVIF